MIKFILFCLTTIPLITLGTRALKRRSCLSLLTQYAVEEEIKRTVLKSLSLREAKLNFERLKICNTGLLDQKKIKIKLRGKIE